MKEKEKVRCVFAEKIQLTDENHQLNQFSAFIWKRIGWITNLTVYKWACEEVKINFAGIYFTQGFGYASQRNNIGLK